MNIKLYALGYEKLFEGSKVQQSCFRASALPRVFATFADETAHPLQIKQPAGCCVQVAKLDDEGNVLRGEVSSAIELCLEESPSLLYEKEEYPAPEVRDVVSNKEKLSSSTISISKNKNKTATRSEGGEEDGLRGAEPKEVGVEVDEWKLTMVSKEKKMGTPKGQKQKELKRWKQKKLRCLEQKEL